MRAFHAVYTSLQAYFRKWNKQVSDGIQLSQQRNKEAMLADFERRSQLIEERLKALEVRSKQGGVGDG